VKSTMNRFHGNMVAGGAAEHVPLLTNARHNVLRGVLVKVAARESILTQSPVGAACSIKHAVRPGGKR